MAKTDQYTVEQIEKALREAKGFVTIAAKIAGCEYNTLMRYVKKYEHLQKVKEEIEESLLDFTESKLYKQIDEGNTTAIIFHLKCKGKKRGYVDRQEIEHTGPGGGPIEIKQVFDSWTEEELERYAATGEKPDRFK